MPNGLYTNYFTDYHILSSQWLSEVNIIPILHIRKPKLGEVEKLEQCYHFGARFIDKRHSKTHVSLTKLWWCHNKICTSATEQEVIENPFLLTAVGYYREASDQKKIRVIAELLFFALFSNLLFKGASLIPVTPVSSSMSAARSAATWLQFFIT